MHAKRRFYACIWLQIVRFLRTLQSRYRIDLDLHWIVGLIDTRQFVGNHQITGTTETDRLAVRVHQ